MSFNPRPTAHWAALLSLSLLAACGGSSDALYSGEASAALGAAGNQARCSTCHALDAAPVGLSGNSFTNIAFLERYKGGDAPTLLAASNACVTGWMGGPALTDGSAAWSDLKAFLESVSDPGVTRPNELSPEVLEDQAAYQAAYQGGDAAAGAAKYARSCGGCHDVGLVVGSAPSLPRATLAAFPAGRIAQKVRTSGPPPSGMSEAEDSTPGPMPFFEPKDLSREDLRDIIAFLRS